MKRTLTLLLLSLMAFACGKKGYAPEEPAPNAEHPNDKEISALIDKMTLEEKVGQLNFLVGDLFNTGPTVRTTESDRFDGLIRDGKMTGLFNVHGAEYTARLQKIAVEESRLGIPLVFGADVIHGFKTVFPIPLASAASWDMEAIEQAERVAAIESTATGITFNFAPMVDISRDPRWGRIAESAGEDPYLGSQVAMARVRGFQGEKLDDPRTLAACVKHFAAYGAPVGGRDYNTVDMSERVLREVYLPPYKAGVEAGAATFMSSFNEYDGVPASGNKFLFREVLRGEWGFDGMVVSDWQSITEMLSHGNVADSAEAAILALESGIDMDMMANVYLDHVPALIKDGKLDEKYLDEAVRNVLRLKYDLGLFEDPYRYSDVKREKAEIRSQEHLEYARDAARKSVVLLKNDSDLLPLPKKGKKIALIGPLADNKKDMNGTWSFFGEQQHPISFRQGINEALGKGNEVLFAEGCNLYDMKTDKFDKAVATAKKADVVVMVVGESAIMNGESGSRTDIDLPGVQADLVKAVAATGKPVVMMVMSGRALALSNVNEEADAILAVWTLGSEAGRAAADVLFGDYNPSGKLPVTFPRTVGQVPIYYAQKQTGRPYTGDYPENYDGPLWQDPDQKVYKSMWIDVPNTPLYPFGYGLSYTAFEYSDIKLDKNRLNINETLTVSVDVKNVGKYDGEEVVQLYIRDLVGSVTRPVKELKGFQKVMIKKGETKTVKFEIKKEHLSFWRQDMTYGTEPGEFHVFVGTDSDTMNKASFQLTP